MCVQEATIHSHRVRYRLAGDGGSVVVLLHGIAGSSATWLPVIEDLAEHHTIIAPDLIGHGLSAKPRGDYSLGAYASGVRDLLDVLGYQRATLVGHSLGGGIALQFSYLFPERCERLVLVGSGGLGREVNAALRAASLPGAEVVLPLLAHRRAVAAGDALTRGLRRIGLRTAVDVEQFWAGYRTLSSSEGRAVFLHTLRSIVEPGGQRVDATERLYLAADRPTLLVWGEQDRMIPVAHGRAAAELIPGSQLITFPDAGHFPHCDEPRRFSRELLGFLASAHARGSHAPSHDARAQ